MNIEQVSDLLARVQVGDNREVDDPLVLEWFDVVGDLDYGDALEAVRRHRRESTDYLQPAHVRRGVAVIHREQDREERIAEQRSRMALPRPVVTLDRAEFDRLTEESKRATRIAEGRDPDTGAPMGDT